MVNTHGLTLFGSGSEWFWSMLQFVVVAVTLIAVGGVLYTVGALVYGIKRPNPSPRWFGFHEIFHTLTVAAFTVHYVAASMTVYGAGTHA